MQDNLTEDNANVHQENVFPLNQSKDIESLAKIWMA